MSTTKLTAHQNQQITEALCRMAEGMGWDLRKDADADNLRAARRAMVQECEEVNLATRKDAFAPEYIPRTATEAGYSGPLTGTGNADSSMSTHTNCC